MVGDTIKNYKISAISDKGTNAMLAFRMEIGTGFNNHNLKLEQHEKDTFSVLLTIKKPSSYHLMVMMTYKQFEKEYGCTETDIKIEELP